MLNLDALNDAQRKAVVYGEGDLLVLAGPGSGKTFTIVQRIFYLLEVCKVPAEQILVVTFTKDAAVSMQKRFLEQSRGIQPVNFGTFHSIFYHILKETHNLKDNKIATDKDKKTLMKRVLKRYMEMSVDERTQEKLLRDYLAAVSFYKNTGNPQKAMEKLEEGHRENFADVLKAFTEATRQSGLLDFDDMVYLCKDLLERDGSTRCKWQRRFRYILMDEFQDINPIQYETIKLLAGPDTSLFAVGDDDQSIYGFRGSATVCLKQFLEDYHAKKVYLDINYRSKREIVEASVKVISENTERFDKKLRSAEEDDDKEQKAVWMKSFEEREEQYEYLVQELRERLACRGTTAVLFRTNAYMQSFAARLNRQGIPYQMKEKSTNIYDHFIVKDIMAYLTLLQNPADRKSLLQIMNKPERNLSRESLGKGNSIADMKQYYRESDGGLLKVLEKWERDMQNMKRMPLFLQVSYIRKGIGYEKYLRGQLQEDARWEEWQEILDFLSGESKAYENYNEWVDAQARYEEKLKNQSGNIAMNHKEGNEIILMTVHASKGLEFDAVYIPDCNEKIFPHGKMLEKAVCEEERRIFYVAMTRAKKSLGLYYLTGTKERPRLPSRFLNPLLD